MRAALTHREFPCVMPLRIAWTKLKCQDSVMQLCLMFYSIMQESSVTTEYYKPNEIKHLQRIFPYYSIIL